MGERRRTCRHAFKVLWEVSLEVYRWYVSVACCLRGQAKISVGWVALQNAV